MQERFRIKLFLLLKLFHHVLAEVPESECENEPSAPVNAKVSCTGYAGCRAKCERRYLFPTGEKVVYYSCTDGEYKLTSDNPEQYDECKPVCKPPCSNGGNCVRPNTCDCPTGWTGNTCEQAECKPPCSNGGTCFRPDICDCPTGWTGDTCQQEITTEPVVISTPIYITNLGTTQLSTELLETTIHINDRSNISSKVTDILNVTTTYNPAFITDSQPSMESLQTTINSKDSDDMQSTITDMLDTTSSINVAHIDTNTYSSVDLLQTTIISFEDMTSPINTEYIETTTQVPTELLQSTINSIGGTNMSSTITGIKGMNSSVNVEYIETTTQLSTELFDKFSSLFQGESDTTFDQGNSSSISTNYQSDDLTEETTIFFNSSNDNSMNNGITSISSDILNDTKELNITGSIDIYNHFTTRRPSLYNYTYTHFSELNNSNSFSTVSADTENSTYSTFKNIIAYMLSIFDSGQQEGAACPYSLWWLVPLLLSITALLVVTNVVLNILTLKWRRDLAKLRKIALRTPRPSKSMPITFFRSLELNNVD